jgi:hypothetical protein
MIYGHSLQAMEERQIRVLLPVRCLTGLFSI